MSPSDSPLGVVATLNRFKARTAAAAYVPAKCGLSSHTPLHPNCKPVDGKGQGKRGVNRTIHARM
jgi:hypothetical protein